MDALWSMVTPVATSSQTRDDSPKRELEVKKVSSKPVVSFREQFQTLYQTPEVKENPTRLAPTTRFRPVAMFLT